MVRITREAYDVVIGMKLGLGSNKIAKGLGLSHGAVLSRQNTLEKLGVISKGTMDGTRRSVLLADSEFTVEAEHRGTIADRAAADRSAAATREARNLARQERQAKKRAEKAVTAVEVDSTVAV